MSGYTAEDYVSFIETDRRDKMNQEGLELVAKRFRELEANSENEKSLERKPWLEEDVLEHITKNPKKDIISICIHFKLRTDIVMLTLQHLVEDGKVKKKILWG